MLTPMEKAFDGKEGTTPFDGFMINPKEDMSSLLEGNAPRIEKFFEDDMKEEEDAIEDFPCCSESVGSSSGQCFEDSANCDSSATLIPNLDSPRALDADCLSCSVSLMNLDGEDSNWWVSESELDFKCFQDIPSPSSRSCGSGKGLSSLTELENENLYYDLSSSDHVSEEAECDSLKSSEPLFWPSERKCDWSSGEAWDGFCISPRKDIKMRVPSGTSPISVKSKADPKNLRRSGSCKRRLVFNSESTTSKIMDWKERSKKKNGAGRINSITKQSRLSKSAKASMKVVPIMEVETEDGNASKPSDEIFLVEGLSTIEEFCIEKIVGLGEFDGHEGVDPEFNENEFVIL